MSKKWNNLNGYDYEKRRAGVWSLGQKNNSKFKQGYEVECIIILQSELDNYLCYWDREHSTPIYVRWYAHVY